jgi:CspA family cold shock protein
MLSMEDIESGSNVTHKNTGLRYSIVEAGEDEVLLSPQSAEMQDLVAPLKLFREEFVLTDRFSSARARGRSRGRRRRRPTAATPSGPRVRGRIKKLVRERGFGFVRGDDGKEVFFHRSGLGATDYDSLSEGDAVEYVVQEGPRGARAENVRAATEAAPVPATVTEAPPA